MTIDPTITISDVITAIVLTFTSSSGLFYLWFKNHTSKFVTFKDFNSLQSLVLKIENENKTALKTIELNVVNIVDTGKLKHDSIVKELEHINQNIKNADRSYEIMSKFFERENERDKK